MAILREKVYLAALLHDVGKFCDCPQNNLVNDEQLTNIDSLILEADKLSSGINAKDFDNLPDFKCSLLQNIQSSTESRKYVIAPQKLNLSKSSFPKRREDLAGDYSADKTKLWNEFIEEFKFIQSNDVLSFAETLLNVLFRYTVNVPASALTPDISLYDHIKTTAAIATCLNDYKESGASGDAPFIIIGGDMSGIQDYIYEIISKYAGKNLKGRSFYLRLLSDAIVRYLLLKLNLYRANIIYDSGGSFYILAPNTDETKDKLKEAVQTIEECVFKEHGTRLYMAIDYVEVTKATLLHQENKKLGEVWHELFEKRDHKKQAKMASYIKGHYSNFFEPILRGGDAWRDAITGEEATANEKPYTCKDIQGIDGKVRKINGQQIVLGKLLKATDVMVVSDCTLQFLTENKIEEFNPAGLGFCYYFLKKEEVDAAYEQLQQLSNHVTLVTFNGKNMDCDFIFKRKGMQNINSLQFYGGNNWNEKTFEDMCKNEDGDFERLGILRMDVDNLGSIFQSGISDNLATLSRYAELSRSFDWFFSGYLNRIQEEVGKGQSFIIYSGGDDVFLVGDWHKTIDISKRIREDFRDFTCQNPAFSISGGIAIVESKFPIMKAAEESADEEGNAKQHACEGKEKDSISFMDMPLNWNLEFGQVEELKNTILDFLLTEKLPKSFVSKIMQHWENADFKNHQINELKTYWMLTYDLGRMKERTKQFPEIVTLIQNCINECCSNKKKLNSKDISSDYHALELWAFAARWAELEYRSIKK